MPKECRNLFRRPGIEGEFMIPGAVPWNKMSENSKKSAKQ
jgi:hypothetical protein